MEQPEDELQTAKRSTGTDILIKCLEDFSSAEATSILVIFIDEQGQVNYRSNAGRAEAVGMLETIKHFLLHAS